MKLDEIKFWYEYHHWAYDRILTTCERVSEEQYIAPAEIGIGFNSLRGTLVHTLDVDMAWRRAFQKHFVAASDFKPGAPAEMWDQTDLTEGDLPTFAALKEFWQTEKREMRASTA